MIFVVMIRISNKLVLFSAMIEPRCNKLMTASLLRQSSEAAAAGVHPGPMSRTEAFARAETLGELGRKI
ncbi:hypothetical protein ACC695_40465, partial [Rhizobium ruizarguesonis]